MVAVKKARTEERDLQPLGCADFPDACAHELFAQQAARTPDAPAIVCGARQLTYRQLNERANQVAHHLRRRGAGRESLVGVALERSPELVVALLGTWKAGAAYVPLDPTYPPQRLAFMVRDAGLRLLLTEAKCRPLFAATWAQAVCLDADLPAIARESSANPPARATAANLAYVMYTSGSTGEPKGAMIVHRGLTNYLRWAIGAYGFQPGDSVPLHSSISFDLTVTSLYPPLLVGGQVELLPEDVAAQELVAALRRRRDRSVVKITPAHLELLNQQLSPGEMSGLCRAFVIGGEELPAEILRPWRRHAPATRLINEYGPTETVVGCCIHEVQTADPDSGSVPIGRPIANTRLHVLDADLRPVAPGVTGELYIGGCGVARGYLNRPELTAQKFVADPFSAEPGARLYRSGDLARCRPDGNIEYRGRVDDQVKVQGYRIEPGEIAAALRGHAGVRDAAVLPRQSASGDTQLMAYVVPKQPRQAAAAQPPADGEIPSADTLLEYLADRLPAYMLPSAIVLLDEFPLTTNGKLDRQALLAVADRVPPAGAGKMAPRTDTERGLASIWREVLGTDDIAVDDDFFELGGQSLSAIRIVARVRSVFDVDLPLRDLFDQPTIAGLARIIDERSWLAQGGAPEGTAPNRIEIAL